MESAVQVAMYLSHELTDSSLPRPGAHGSCKAGAVGHLAGVAPSLLARLVRASSI